MVTRDEVRRRFVELADEVSMGLGLSLNGERVNLDPDFSRFEFKDLDNPGADLDAGIDASVARIYYKLVYDWRAPQPLEPGRHALEFFFNSPQTVVHTPHEQLFALDAQGNALPAEYDLAHHAFPRLRADFRVEEHVFVLDDVAVNPRPQSPRGFGELPGWLTLALGAMLAALGAVLLIVKKPGQRRSTATGLLLLTAGAAAILGALVQIGAIGV